VRTPSKALLVVPTKALAEALAAEWQAQGHEIRPSTMPLTRLLNSTLDGVRGSEAAVADDIAKYAATDLVCYRASGPAELVRRQAAHWDPLVAWAGEAFDCRLTVGAGLMPVEQPAGLIARVRAQIDTRDIYRLAATHVATTLLGSAVLALALARSRIDADAAWAAAHVDEDWQAGRWGRDEEAEARRRLRRSELGAAAAVIALA
jgi:chaperone required for assembly of F1-ATPase